MPAYPRNQIVASDSVGVYHCIARCVRRAFLCGVDSVTGHDYEHRKDWLRERLQQLASVFGIDICGYAVMSNHLHLILRSRPDLVQDWSDDDVALRWKTLFPPRDPETGQAAEPSECDLNMIMSNPDRVTELRKRLASLSWFMRCLSEPIARRANREDRCTGRFWEGRFKSQKLLDEAAILACSVYVDLNPVRANVAETPEQSEHTSVFDRIRSLPAFVRQSAPSSETEATAQIAYESIGEVSPTEPQRPDSWLCELTIQEGPSQQVGPSPTTVQESGQTTVSEVLAAPSPLCPLRTGHEFETSPIPPHKSGLTAASVVPAAPSPSCRSRADHAPRASDQGYLPISLDTYFSLLDWTGRQIHAASPGAIPAQFAPILERLGLNSEGWIETIRCFGRWFKQMVGRRKTLATLAERTGRRWFQGQRAAAVAFH